jgi:hypothetical protein
VTDTAHSTIAECSEDEQFIKIKAATSGLDPEEEADNDYLNPHTAWSDTPTAVFTI